MGIQHREGRNKNIHHFNALESHELSTHLVFVCKNYIDLYKAGIFTWNPVLKRQINEIVLLL